jgi:hypothetical protein
MTGKIARHSGLNKYFGNEKNPGKDQQYTEINTTRNRTQLAPSGKTTGDYAEYDRECDGSPDRDTTFPVSDCYVTVSEKKKKRENETRSQI